MTLKTGEILHNRYRVVKLLAKGGFGALYRIWDTSLGRPCVLKENLTTSPDAQRQFLSEAKILANLHHPHLPRVTDYFLIQGQGQYLVMDYIEGQDLEEMLEDRGSPLPEVQVLEWAGQICDALNYLHSQTPPVIHRDIKPANIRINSAGEAVLVDFGIAKVYDPKKKTTLGAQAVSPGYSPHEQYGKGSTDARSDIYALGATLYVLLTGEEPVESIQRILNDPLVPARQLNPSLSMRTSAALMRAMQMDASQRFQNASEFKLALTPPPPVRVAAPPAVSSQQPFHPVAATISRTTPPWTWIAAVGLLSLIIIFLLARLTLGGIGTPSSGDAPQTSPLSGIAVSTPESGSVATISSVNTPTLTSPAEPTLTPLVYMVQPGDTCSEIAEAFGVSVRQIVSQNQGLAPDCGILFAGQALLIPQVDGPINTPAAIRSPTIQTTQVTQVSNLDGMQLVYIPAGEFKMGAEEDDQDASDFERPAHAVALSAFWIDQTEITNQMYAACVSDGGCEPPANRTSRTRDLYYGEPAFAQYPVIYVNWEEADSYCRWAGRRLPTEAEWEKAARGLDGRIYPWGNFPPNTRLSNFGESLGDTSQVGSFPAGASPFGLFDMAGNVAEWVQDWYSADYYAVSVFRNPFGPDRGDFRLIRGGSWFHPMRSIRTTSRLWNYPDLRSDTIGFRCAK